MPDLSANMFYKVKLDLGALAPGDDLLWSVLRHIMEWQTGKWNRRRAILPRDEADWRALLPGGQILSSDRRVAIRSEFFSPDGNQRFWACRITEDRGVENGCAPRQWVTEVGFEQTETNRAVFSCVLFYSDRAGFIGPYPPAPAASIPRLVRDIAADPALRVTSGSDYPARTATELAAGDWPRFHAMLTDPERQFPYIFISPQIPDRTTGEAVLLLDPDTLADTLFGNALVFFTREEAFCREMSYMDDAWACYGGAVRVYLPNNTASHRNRYLSVNDINDIGPDNVIAFLRRAFAQNMQFYESFFRPEDCRKRRDDHQRELRLAQLKASHLEQQKDMEASWQLTEEAEEQRLAAEARAARLEDELRELRDRTFSLESQVEQMRSAAEENAGLRRAVDARLHTREMPSTVEDVVDYFSLTYADRLVFSDDAIRSLKSCVLEPAVLWEIFYALATCMRDLFLSGSGDIWKAFQTKTGIDVTRGEGGMTRKDKAMMKQFETRVGPETVDIQPHITFGRQGQSVHFGYSPAQRKVVIGHCGEHLTVFSSQKKH